MVRGFLGYIESFLALWYLKVSGFGVWIESNLRRYWQMLGDIWAPPLGKVFFLHFRGSTVQRWKGFWGCSRSFAVLWFPFGGFPVNLQVILVQCAVVATQFRMAR